MFINKALSHLIHPGAVDNPINGKYGKIGLGEGGYKDTIDIIKLLEETGICLECPYGPLDSDETKDSSQIIIKYTPDIIHICYRICNDNLQIVETKQEIPLDNVKDILEDLENKSLPFYNEDFEMTYP